MGRVKGCHLVGSVCLPDTDTVFRECTAAMPGRLKRIPDGETGVRHYFTHWQRQFFQATPEMLLPLDEEYKLDAPQSFTPEQVSASIENLRRAAPKTGYDEAAVESYQKFVALRRDGAIQKGVRFQVCLPSYFNIGHWMVSEFRSEGTAIYEEALLRDMRALQNAIPHEDLAIQIDLAVDTAIWIGYEHTPPWFHEKPGELEQRRQYMVDHTVRMISLIDPDVEVGIHNCYGDLGHKHFVEPESLAVITERGLVLFEKTPRRIDFFHVPVPLSAMDKLDSYFTPILPLLPKFAEHGTDLYLGLVHPNDLEGTKKRVDAAKAALGDFDFGVATECGWGRTPHDEVASIMDISREVSEAVVPVDDRIGRT